MKLAPCPNHEKHVFTPPKVTPTSHYTVHRMSYHLISLLYINIRGLSW